MATLDPGATGRRPAERRRRASPLLMTVPEAGRKYFGLGKNASYDAARQGIIPTIKTGKKRQRVPVAACERLHQQARSTLEK